MKPLSEGKSRLATEMTREQRAELVVGMLRRVIGAIRSADIGLFWVVGGDDRVMHLTRNSDGVWFEELGRDLNDTVTRGFKPSDVIGLLRSSERGNNITLAPARRDGGTNGIVVPHGIPFMPQLGQRSFARHLAQAASAGISVAISYSQGLGFDLDTIDDLESYEHMEPGLLRRLVPQWDSLAHR